MKYDPEYDSYKFTKEEITLMITLLKMADSMLYANLTNSMISEFKKGLYNEYKFR